MKRGDLVTVSLHGDYGKPRPAVVVQNDAVAGFDSVIVCPVTTARVDAEPALIRLTLEPTERNGLRARSEVMVEKISVTARDRVGQVIGALSADERAALDRRLAFVLGLGS